MKKQFKRIIQFISTFKPSNIYKILVYFYEDTIYKSNRTTKFIRIIEENNYNSFLEVGVLQGENLIPIANYFPKVKRYGEDPYSGDSLDNYYKAKIMALEAAVKFKNESLDVVFIDARVDPNT